MKITRMENIWQPPSDHQVEAHYVKQLETRIQKALWFMYSFRQQLKGSEIKQNDGVRHRLNL